MAIVFMAVAFLPFNVTKQHVDGYTRLLRAAAVNAELMQGDAESAVLCFGLAFLRLDCVAWWLSTAF